MSARPAALTVLPLGDANWRTEFLAGTPRAQRFAEKLPLVRVVVPAPDHPRRELELIDVFRDGLLKPSHKSPVAAQCETRLGCRDALYFHGGRTHPEYGFAAIIIDDLPPGTSLEVTPFGLGGMLCASTSAAPHTCVAPVAHDAQADQAEFTARSTWLADQWRARTAEYIALYFGPDPRRYFLSGIQGRPLRMDPAGIFADPRTADWRAWTLEVRVHADVNLFDVLAEKRVIAWALDESIERELLNRMRAGETFPWFERLMELRERRFIAPRRTFPHSLAKIDAEVRARCLT